MGATYRQPRCRFWSTGAYGFTVPSRPLVLLHGQPGSGRDWQAVQEHLEGDFVVTAVDRPGYGSDPAPGGGFEVNAAAVVADLDARGIDRAVLVGHSYGGGVALATALAAPERVEALVLVASVGPGCLDGWDRLLSAPIAGEVCALSAWWLTPRFARARMALLERRQDRPLRVDEQVNWQVWAETHRLHGGASVWRTVLAEQRALTSTIAGLVDRLGSVAQPTLVLADPRDPLIPFRTSEGLCAALPHAQLQPIHDVGHHLPRRAAPEVAEAISSFLTSLQDVSTVAADG